MIVWRSDERRRFNVAALDVLLLMNHAKAIYDS
jgi:hypothetical protein